MLTAAHTNEESTRFSQAEGASGRRGHTRWDGARCKHEQLADLRMFSALMSAESSDGHMA